MKRSVVSVLLLFAACSGGVCGCLVDTTAQAVVVGTVADASSAPVRDVEVGPLGVLSFDCGVRTNPVWADPTPAVSGADGRFAMTIATFDGSGVHCVDMLIHVPASGFTDTILAVQVEFRHHLQVPDTVALEIVVAG